MSYTHLSASERFALYHYRSKEHLSLDEIALKMNRSKSTISRELKRNSLDKGDYLPDSAHLKMQIRRQQSKQKFMTIRLSVVAEVKQRLESYHSPEQISGRLQREGLAVISHETIYQMIYANYQGVGSYQSYLRRSHPKRRRRAGVKSKRGTIRGRVGLEQRPTIADEKVEIGHWESDTIIGGNHTGLVVTHVDKASKFLFAGLARNKTVQQINQVTLELFA